MTRTLKTALLSAALLLGGVAAPASACPMCKDSIPNEDQSGKLAADANGSARGNGDAADTQAAAVSGGFNASVYLMLSAFVGVLGFVGLTLYRGARDASYPVDGAMKGTKEHESEDQQK
ncbi:MAG TPA: hypothetical protein VF796_18950 [Humisphaera sp.]